MMGAAQFAFMRHYQCLNCRSKWVKRGATVLDVGINLVQKSASGGDAGEGTPTGTIVGDVASRDVSRVASALTPVPGGVGPMTIAALIHNVVLAAKYRTNITKW
jgi:methylenetetrahydrofolate dehydrogenase (NADP+) / methenyltetrahydrofolate cyclohydrolase